MGVRATQLAAGAVAMTLAAVFGCPASAQTFPTAPVRIVLGSGAGGAPDVIGRITAEHLSRLWGQQTFVANHPGAAGAIAMRLVGAAPPNGHTLLQAISSSFIALPEIQSSLPFDLARDFVPIGLIGEQPMVIAASPTLRLDSLTGLFKLASQRPGGINVAVLSRGGLPHLTAEWLRSASGVPITAVHYTSTPQALTDVSSGRVDAIVDGLPALMGAVASGSLTMLAIASADRLADYPNIPTVEETIPQFRATGWFALMAPPETPAQVARKVSDDLRNVLGQTDLQHRFRDLATYVHPLSPSEMLSFIREEQQRWKPVIQQIGIASPK